jgi:hypothetical protein
VEIIGKTDSPRVGISLDLGNFSDNPAVRPKSARPARPAGILKSQLQAARKNQRGLATKNYRHRRQAAIWHRVRN